MHTDIPLIYKGDIFKDISDDIKKWFGTSKYDKRRRKRPLPAWKTKKVINSMKDEKGRN